MIATSTPDPLPHWDASFLEMAVVRPEYSLQAHDQDRAMHGRVTPARARQAAAVASASRAGGAGLVLVPTTQEGALPASFQLDHRSAGAALRDSLEVLELDPIARRVSGLRMAVGFAARAHSVSARGHRSDVPHLVTLTYRGDNSQWDGTHVRRAISMFRNWCAKKSIYCRYVWVAELQKRGVIHYHIAAWLPPGQKMPHWDSRGWWKEGMSNSIVARCAVAYLMSYLKKGDIEARGALPKGARNYGVGGLEHSLRRARRWLRLPRFVQGNSSIYDDWKRVVGGGWSSPDGEIFRSEFQMTFVAGKRCVMRVCRHAVLIDASGPFSWVGDVQKAVVLESGK